MLYKNKINRFVIQDFYTNPYPSYGRRLRVTPTLNCTSQLAQSQGGNGSTCSFHRYSMGLFEILNYTYTSPNSLEEYALPIDADTKKQILSLVLVANPPNITTADFNATIPDFNVGGTGFYLFNPRMICYNGTLSGCDSSNGLEGARIQTCGEQQYKGYVSFFPPITAANETDPQPTYAEAAGNATVNKICNSTGNSTNSGDDTNMIPEHKDTSFADNLT
ncbi:hypothetical protein F5Y03DRAFT_386517 [Xylaria venustula]|nr:hypothetical protein F5Y03DRAFT_386517 [Xylaria venustula]